MSCCGFPPATVPQLFDNVPPQVAKYATKSQKESARKRRQRERAVNIHEDFKENYDWLRQRVLYLQNLVDELVVENYELRQEIQSNE